MFYLCGYKNTKNEQHKKCEALETAPTGLCNECENVLFVNPLACSTVGQRFQLFVSLILTYYSINLMKQLKTVCSLSAAQQLGRPHRWLLLRDYSVICRGWIKLETAFDLSCKLRELPCCQDVFHCFDRWGQVYSGYLAEGKGSEWTGQVGRSRCSATSWISPDGLHLCCWGFIIY